jgi:ribulose 1,5-bisphosphate synthetase/thiazole synthase
MNEHQRNLYQLAENLGMTVTRMSRDMTMSEYFGWMAFYGEKAAEAERESKKKPPMPRKDGELVMRGFGI